MTVRSNIWDEKSVGSLYHVNDQVSFTIRNHVWGQVRFPVADRVLDLAVHVWREIRNENRDN